MTPRWKTTALRLQLACRSCGTWHTWELGQDHFAVLDVDGEPAVEFKHENYLGLTDVRCGKCTPPRKLRVVK